MAVLQRRRNGGDRRSRRASRDQPLAASESCAAAKWQHLQGSLELELLGARHYRDNLAGPGLSGNLAGGVWRFDLTETFTEDDDAVTSFLFNMDRSWICAERNLYRFVMRFDDEETQR